MSGPAAGTGPAAAWPEVAATSRVVWPLVLWRASSDHPELGPVRGRGLTHAAALRSLVRQVQRRTPHGGPPRSPDGGIKTPPLGADERCEEP
ncbi:MAG: hypothetical protein AB7G65_03140 [Thermoleophilia bacterium]